MYPSTVPKKMGFKVLNPTDDATQKKLKNATYVNKLSLFKTLFASRFISLEFSLGMTKS